MNLTDCNRQWSSRPDDERFESLLKLQEHVRAQRQASRGLVVSGLTKATSGLPVPLTNWSFGQLAQRAGAPAAYLATLPSPMAADCLNYGLLSRDADDLGALVREVQVDGQVGAEQLAAVTGPGYGRVWNSDIVDAMVERFGDGVTGQWTVPGYFEQRLARVTKENTTLYASDRDLWVFLADETQRIEIPNRRNGQPGSLYRGFFDCNSEVGSKTCGLKTFAYDGVCGNRIVWGAQDVQTYSVRHTASAPDKWLDTVRPALETYSRSSTSGILNAVKAAQATRLASGDTLAARNEKVEDFLARRFTRGQARAIMAAHLADEGRPVETAWDAVVGATAYARSIPHQDARVEVETRAGALMAA